MAKQARDHIYNMENTRASIIIDSIGQLLPNHPAHYFFTAINISWEEKPVDFKDPKFDKHRNYLIKAIDIAEKMREESDDNVEGTLFSLLGNSLLAQYYADQGSTFKAVGAAKKTYSRIKEGFELIEACDEFYFSSGIYNYYREKYPELHPVYKPFLWFFKSGDKSTGLQQLRTAAAEAVLTKVEANLYLIYILVRYEAHPAKALKYSQELVNKYPNNKYFKALHCETLALAGKINQANAIARRFKKGSNYYRALSEWIYGLKYEKAGKLKKARRHYDASIEISQKMEDHIRNYLSLAHLGLGRTYKALSKTETAEKHFKLALKYADYEHARNEAKAHLN